MRTLKNSSSPYREIFFTRIAAVITGLAGGDAIRSISMRAFNAIGPYLFLKICSCGFLIRKHFKQLESAYSHLVVHGRLLSLFQDFPFIEIRRSIKCDALGYYGFENICLFGLISNTSQ